MKNDKVYLQHILDSIDTIEMYIENIEKDEFLNDPKLVNDGVVRQLEIIGEATKNISEEYRRGHPEVEWSKVIGMRNRIAHEYFYIDYEVVWDTVKRDLPKLKEQIQRLLK